MSNLTTTSKENWLVIKEQAQAVKDAGLLPAQMTAAQAAIIVMKGQELGVPTMRALEGMFVVNGKVSMDAKFMMSLIRERCPQAKITVKRKDDKGCVIEATRPHQEPELFQFLEADAQRAQLIKPNSPWTKYPANMYWARTVSQMARQLFSDILGAAYVSEEIGGEVQEQEVNNERHSLTGNSRPIRENINSETIKGPSQASSINGTEETVQGQVVTQGTHESDLNSRFAPSGSSLAVTSKPVTVKKEVVEIKTGEIIAFEKFDEKEDLPNFKGDDKGMHWKRIATAGQHSGKSLIQILEEVGRDSFIKMYQTSTRNIAKMGNEGKPIPDSTMLTYKDLESCVKELEDTSNGL